MEKMSGDPEDDLAHGPMRGWVADLHVWNGDERSADLGVEAVEPKVEETESEGDALGGVPVRGWSVMREFGGCDLGAHVDLWRGKFTTRIDGSQLFRRVRMRAPHRVIRRSR